MYELDDTGRRRRWYADGVLRQEMLEGGYLSVYTRAGGLAIARGRSVKIGEIPFLAEVKEFSTGSLGWYLNGKTTIDVGGPQCVASAG